MMRFISRTSKDDEANEPSDWAVYSKPWRRRILVPLCLVVAWNSFLFIFSCIATYTILHPTGILALWQIDQPPTNAAPQFVVFLFWCLVPLVIWANSCFELYKRWRRTLRAKRIVVTGSLSILLWIFTPLYWLPCIYSYWEQSWWTGRPPYHPQYCPFPEGPGWYPHEFGLPSPPSAYYLLPWLVLPGLMFYSFYLTYGGMALHRQRKARSQQLGNTVARGGDAEVAEKRYKITSSLYTTVNTESDWPSTLHSDAGSPEPSTRPPSYSDLSSGRPSVRSVERAVVRTSRSEPAADSEDGSQSPSRT